MSQSIDVEITGAGRVRAGGVEQDPKVRARCNVCGGEVDAAVSIAAPGAAAAYACAPCLRARLDALSVGRFRLREGDSGGLPWGKISG